MSIKPQNIIQKIDWLTVALFLALAILGILTIYSVEHRDTDIGLLLKNKNYYKQLIFFGLSLIVGFVILMIDSKFFTSIPFLSYLIGFLLLLLALTPLGKGVKGSHSWLNLGFMTFQPGELMKLFTALSLAKYLSMENISMADKKQRIIALILAILPALIIILQNETGLALVYFSFFIAMYREGLPNIYLLVCFSLMLLGIATLLFSKYVLLVIITVAAILFLFSIRQKLKRNKELLVFTVALWLFGVLFSQVLVPFAFKHVLQSHHIDRIYSLIGQDVPDEYIKLNKSGVKIKTGTSDYNVRQSKIAIASGGFIGKGWLNGTQTQYDWVPEQRTDFIFCPIAEQFGFLGSMLLITLYTILLLRIIHIAERQRSNFSRIYAYGLAGILFFHLIINIGMTIGLAPVIGIPLPLVSYGGTSLLTFATMIFILVKLDSDRNRVLR